MFSILEKDISGLDALQALALSGQGNFIRFFSLKENYTLKLFLIMAFFLLL